MDEILLECVVRNVLSRRVQAILDYVGRYLIGDDSEEQLIGQLKGLFADEKGRLTAEEILGQREGEKTETEKSIEACNS